MDGLHLYYRIHGLEEPGRDGPTIYETGVRRFLELFDRHGVKATFFLVGEDLADPRNLAVAREIAEAGHEIASHSQSHRYDLSILGESEMERELALAEVALSPLRGGRPPSGFRAPGYNLSAALLGLLRARGYRYDSSAFPCPPYYLTKAAIIGAYRLVGRRSGSLVGDPSVMWSPRGPYQRTVPGGDTLLELPVTVLPGVRFPVIGTSLILLDTWGWKIAHRLLSGVSFVNIEFHAIDLTDHRGDGIDDALLAQPDQRVSLDRKLATFDLVLSTLGQDRHFSTLEDVAYASEGAAP